VQSNFANFFAHVLLVVYGKIIQLKVQKSLKNHLGFLS
jgi:hypothetical protein